ncbi:MAG: type II secretion system F family protein [Candidatus Omnitrophota bacterium]
MFKFEYTARDAAGKLVEGTLEAKTRLEAISQLRNQSLTIIILSKLKLGQAKEKKEKERSKPKAKRKRFFDVNRVGLSELAIFSRQLSVAINSGVTILDGLSCIAEDMDNPFFKEVLDEIVADVNSGSSLSEAMAKHRKEFGVLFVALIRSAEESGSMPKMLEYLSTYLEKSVSLNIKIRSIMAYPIFISVFFVIVVIIMTLFILPRFDAIFSGFDAQLPWLTQTVFKTNRFIIRNFPIISFVSVAFCVWVSMYNRTVRGRFRIDKFKLKLPLFGKLIQKIVIARFCQVMAVMLRGGVPIGIALDVASDTCDNKIIEKSLRRVKDDVMSGSDIADSLGQDKIFPRFVVRMVSIGESSGRLDEVMDKIAKMYEDQIEGTIMIATALFEPIVITVFGVFVLIILLSIYIPIFKIASSMRA